MHDPDLHLYPTNADERAFEERAWLRFKKEYAARQASIDAMKRTNRIAQVALVIMVLSIVVMLGMSIWRLCR